MSTDRVDPYEVAIRNHATNLLKGLATKLLDDIDRKRWPAAAARASKIAEAASELFDLIWDHLDRQPTGA